MARSEDWSCPLRLPTPAAAHVAIASGVSQRVTSPHRTKTRSYSAHGFPPRRTPFSQVQLVRKTAAGQGTGVRLCEDRGDPLTQPARSGESWSAGCRLTHEDETPACHAGEAHSSESDLGEGAAGGVRRDRLDRWAATLGACPGIGRTCRVDRCPGSGTARGGRVPRRATTARRRQSGGEWPRARRLRCANVTVRAPYSRSQS